MLRLKLKLITLLILMVCLKARSQSEKEQIQNAEIQRQIERQRKVIVSMDSAVRLSEEGRYEEADVKFRNVLKTIRSVPSDLTFHFGKNSFLMGKYRQSVDWLNKYIQLKGTAGQYSAEAVELLEKSEIEVLKERALEAKTASQVLSKDYDIDCGPTGRILCPICRGSTVVIRTGYFGETYKTCPYCSRKGYLLCHDYNKLIRGELHPVE